MARKKQLELSLRNERSMIGKPFGGGRLRSHPKTKRPFSRRHLIHLILKSSQAKGAHSFLHTSHKAMIDRIVRGQARRHGVHVHDFVNVGNHLHLLIKSPQRQPMIRFLRAISGLIPRRVLKCERGNPLAKRFWDARPFTKIIAAGRSPFRIIRRYFDKNRRQAQTRVEGFDFFGAVGFG